MTFLLCAVLAATVSSPLASSRPTTRQEEPAPRILLDQPLRAVEYQLDRLSNEQLVRVERKVGDVRYRPIFVALLTRKGMARAYREEALAALATMNQTSQTRVLLEALARIPVEDALTAEKLLGLLLGQSAGTLRQEREIFAQTIDNESRPLVLRGAYGGLVVGDGSPGPAWEVAVKHEGHLLELLRTVPQLSSDETRAQFFAPVAALLAGSRDAAIRAEALAALGWTRRDTPTFEVLAREIVNAPAGAEAATSAAAIRSLLLLPEAVWPAGQIEPLARSIVTLVRETPPDLRTEPPIAEAIQLGEKLAAVLPDEARRTVRRDLRALGVQVIRIETVFEQMLFDQKWFVVEAGKPVQIVLSNRDAMPHNLIVSKPKSLQEVGTAGAALPLPSDPTVKPYVPDSPLVVAATNLLKEGEVERLNFTAPNESGEYVYLCTFPGHWVRMYGVMLVVPNLEEWEAHPTTPTDPMTNKPFASRRE